MLLMTVAVVEMMMKPLQMMMMVMVDEMMMMKRERNRDYVCLDADAVAGADGAGSLFSFTAVYNSNAHESWRKSNNLYI